MLQIVVLLNRRENNYYTLCVCWQLIYSHPQCCSLLVIVANVGLAGLTHTIQSVLRVVDKLASGGVVMMLAALPSTLGAHLTGLATHSNSNWERVGFPVHSEGAPVQV